MLATPLPADAPSVTGHHRPTGARRRTSRAFVVAATLVAGVTVVLATATEASAATTPEGAGTSLVITGEVVQVQEEGAPGSGEEGRLITAVQDDSTGALVELTGADLATAVDLASGTPVVAVVGVPDEVLDLVPAASSPVADTAAGTPLSDELVAAAVSSDTALPVRTLQAQDAAATTASAAGARTVSVAVVGLPGTPADARFTDAAVAQLIADTSSYWGEQSDGSVSFRQVGATARYTAADSCANLGSLWGEAAAKTGFTQGPGNHLLVLVPNASYRAGACAYGLGTIGADAASGGLSYVADLSWPALAHELGHNLSLQHANHLDCEPGTTDVAQSTSDLSYASAPCTDVAYGDRADLMSTSALDAAGNLGVVGASKLGLLAADERTAVTAAGVTTTTVQPLGGHRGLQALQVTDPRNGNTYWIENRSRTGRDTWGWGGPSGGDTEFGVRVLKQSAQRGSLLLDPTPQARGDRDARQVVAPGTTFRTVGGGVEIRTAAGADGAMTVSVSIAAAGQAHWAGSPEVTPPAGAPAPAPTTADVTRVSGEDRIATAVAVSRELFPDGAPGVVLASSATYADSIGGARLASALGAPLLLTGQGGLDGAVAEEARRLLAPGSTVYVLGGVRALSAEVSDQLAALEGHRVVRLSGLNRFQTAAAVADATTAITGDAGPIYVASGTNFPDGLSVAALAAETGGVVVLTDGSSPAPATADYLAAHDPAGTRTVAIGGPAVAAVPTASRSIVGADRYDTSALVAAEFGAGAQVSAVGLATGANWPDALVGASAMGHLGGPLLLTDGQRLSTSVGASVSALAQDRNGLRGLVLGGEASIGSATQAQLTRLLG